MKKNRVLTSGALIASMLFCLNAHSEITCSKGESPFNAISEDGGCHGKIRAVEVQTSNSGPRVVVDAINPKGMVNIVFTRDDAQIGLSLIQSIGQYILPTSASQENIMSFSVRQHLN